jgi:hypothetical protein
LQVAVDAVGKILICGAIADEDAIKIKIHAGSVVYSGRLQVRGPRLQPE